MRDKENPNNEINIIAIFVRTFGSMTEEKTILFQNSNEKNLFRSLSTVLFVKFKKIMDQIFPIITQAVCDM